MADKDQKTEQPTQRRMKKAREEGNFPTARVFVGALQFLAFVSLIHAWGLDWIRAIRRSMAALFQHALDPRLTAEEIIALSLDLLKHTLVPVAVLGAVLIAITLAVQLGVTRMGVSLKKLAPNFQRLNPLSKLRELPRQNLPSLLQAVIMIPVFGAAVYFLVKDDFQSYLSLPLRSVPSGAAHVAGLHPGPAVEGFIRVRGFRGGRPAAPEAAVPAGSQDEQTGDPRRIQRGGRQSAHEAAHPQAAPRHGAPPHDAGGPHSHRRYRESDPLRRGAEVRP